MAQSAAAPHDRVRLPQPCGDQVLQTRALGGAPVLAVVWATGFSCDKGRLIRSILFPRVGRMDLERDGNRFVGLVLVPMAIAGGIGAAPPPGAPLRAARGALRAVGAAW